MPSPFRRPITPRSCLMLSTALVAVSLSLAPRYAAADYVLDYDAYQSAGGWSQDAAIFEDDTGQIVALPVGETAVLQHGNFSRNYPSDIEVQGEVILGGIEALNDEDTLTGGTLISAAGRSLDIDVNAGNELTIGSALRGDILVSGTGDLVLNTDSQSTGIVTLRVADNSNLIIDGVTSGTLTNSGDVSLNASHNGNVVNNANADFRIGRLNGNSTATVSGNFTNYGNTYAVGGNRTLVVNGTFVNDGQLGSNSGRTTIEATLIELGADSTRTNAVLIGNILNHTSDLDFSDTTLTGDLENAQDGTVTFSGDVDADNHNITNKGTMTVGGDGWFEDAALTNVKALDNSGTLTIRDGSSVVANLTTNSGTFTIENNALLTGNLRNEGGTFTLRKDGRVNGDFHNLGGVAELYGTLNGTLRVSAQTSLIGGKVTGIVINSSQFSSTGTIEGKLTNSSFGNATISGKVGDVENSGTFTLTQNGEINGNFRNLGGVAELYGTLNGTLRVSAQTSLIGGKVTGIVFNSSQFSSTGTIEGKLTNSSFGNATISGGQVAEVDNSGIFALGDNGEILGSFRNLTPTSTATISGKVGDVENSGTFTLTQNGEINGNFHNLGGVAELYGTLNGTLRVSAQTSLIGGKVTGIVFNSSQFSSTGTIEGKLTNSSFGNATISGGQVAEVDNSGIFALGDNGEILGSFRNLTPTSTATISGKVGDVENSGTLTTGGNLDVGTFANSRTATIAAGHTLTASGNVTNAGTLAIETDASLRTSRTFNNSGTLDLVGTLSASTVENKNNGVLNLRGESITGKVNGDAGSRISVQNNTVINGDLTSRGSLELGVNADRTLTVKQFDSYGTIGLGSGITTGILTIQTDEYNIHNQAGVDSDHVRIVGNENIYGNITYTTPRTATGNIRVHDNGSLTVQNVLDVAQYDVTTVEGGKLVVSSQGTVSGQVHSVINYLNGGETIVQAGTSLSVGFAPVTGGAAGRAGTIENQDSGRFEIAGTVSSPMPLTFMNRGDLFISGSLNGNLTNAISNNPRNDPARTTLMGGTITGSVINQGELRGTGTVTGDFRNEGVLTLANGNRLTTDLVRNVGQTTFNGGTLAGNLLNMESGTVRGYGTITGVYSSLAGSTTEFRGTVGHVNNDGTFRTTGDLQITGVGTSAISFRNRGDATIDRGHTLTAATPVENQKNLNIAGTLASNLTNTSGTTTLSGAITGNVANALGAKFEGHGTVSGTITNNGTLNTTGNLQVGGLTNAGTVAISRGAELSGAGTSLRVENAGRLNVAGTLGGSLTNSGTTTLTGGTITASVTNTNSLTGNGTIQGTLNNSGTVAANGALNLRNLSNSGTVTVGGSGNTAALSVTDLTNTGQTTIHRGSSLNVANGVTNSGSLNVQGQVSLASNGTGLTNEANGTLTLNGASITGNIRNLANGLMQIGGNSSVVGNLANNGTIDLTSSGNVLLSVQGGTFTNSGRISASGAGQLTINADLIQLSATSDIDAGHVKLIGNLSNAGRIDYSAPTELTGNLTNRDGGTVLVRADVDANGRNVVNQGSFTVTGGAEGNGNLHDVNRLVNSNAFTVEAGGRVAAASVENSATGTMTIAGRVQSGDPLLNRNQLSLADTGRLVGGLNNIAGANANLAGNVVGNVSNSGTVLASGQITGGVTNSGRFTSNGTVTGRLQNFTGADMVLASKPGQQGNFGAVNNAGALRLVGTVELADLTNAGTTNIVEHSNVNVRDRASNSGTLVIAGKLSGGLQNTGTTQIAGGVISGQVTNNNQLTGTGTINGAVTNTGTLNFTGSTGKLTNSGQVATTGALSVAGLTNSGTVFVRRGHTLSSTAVMENLGRGNFTVNGTLRGDLRNLGTYVQNGTLAGTISTVGKDSRTQINGTINGNLVYSGGSVGFGDNGRVNGLFDLAQGLSVGSGQAINAARTRVQEKSRLDLAGRMNGDVVNNGFLHVQGNEARVDGTLTNNGTLSMYQLSGGASPSLRTAANPTGEVLNVKGLSGNGTYQMDVDLGNMRSDRIVVRGGAATGKYNLALNYFNPTISNTAGNYTTLIDVDETQGDKNNFSYNFNSSPFSTEKIVYSVERASTFGDLQVVRQTNPAIGAVFGNVALTQSLIGSVVNRPTSPFVTGLAAEDKDKPCGYGGWGRVIGGHANATGATNNGVSTIDSEISANYYGMQAGADLACFDDRIAGWDVALGVLGGVNRGNTEQPIYAIDGRNSQNVTKTLTSHNKTDFDQVYGGVYITGTKGQMQADLQYRYERTDFSLTNTAADGGQGLGLDNTDFSSKGSTLSGSLSYAFPLGDQGWTVIPTAGFAWSKMSIDTIKFSDGYKLEFEDSQRKVGFLGATVAKTFMLPGGDSALYAFATGTAYKDFANPTISTFTDASDPDFKPQRLSSDHLGAYSELSIGANYVKVLSQGTGLKPRQFSASARIDGRYGDSLDSVGFTGQVRWQF